METFLTVLEVAAAVQLSPKTIYRYVAKKEIPFHKINTAVRFRPAEIEKWISDRKLINAESSPDTSLPLLTECGQ
jgi:excisionase family DNA binding protein